jgi:hypothetical protein
MRQAQLYGYLVARTDRLYHPRQRPPRLWPADRAGDGPPGMAVIRNGGYEITPEGLRGRTSLVIKGLIGVCPKYA